jgi:magnesium chelatase family protein
LDRYGENKLNGRVTEAEIRPYVDMPQLALTYLKRAAEAFYLSERGIHKILTVSRTIADLEGTEQPTLEHLQEAITYRHRRLVS